MRFWILCVLIACCEMAMAQRSVNVNPVLYSTDLPLLATDSSASFTIRQIVVEGKTKTRKAIFLRELEFAEGETYTAQVAREHLQAAKNALMRTGLFRNVTLTLLRTAPQTADVIIQAEERWYLFPVPFVKPVDYSFMEWIADEHRSTRRINYGLFLSHTNFTGRADQLQLSFGNGFTRRFGLQYSGLFLDPDMRWSASFGGQHSRHRAVSLSTGDNRRVPVNTASNDFVHTVFSAFAELTYRRAIKTRHSFGWNYTQEQIADTVFALANGYEKTARRPRYLNLYYRLHYADVDLMAYPTKGRITELSAVKTGFGSSASLWQLQVRNSMTWPLKKNYFFNLAAVASLKLPFEQPQGARLLMEQNPLSMQGYPGYAVSGVAGGYVKASVARPILGRSVFIPKFLIPRKFDRFREVPFRLYARSFINAGYMHDPSEMAGMLSNRLMSAAGVGLDIVAFNDWVIKLEWSVNLLGQNGLYLQPQNNF
jgi:hypothetical protein